MVCVIKIRSLYLFPIAVPRDEIILTKDRDFLAQIWYFSAIPSVVYWRHVHTSPPLEVEAHCGHTWGHGLITLAVIGAADRAL